MQAYIFLIVLLAVGFIAKNQSLLIAVSVLLVMKVIGVDDKIFSVVQAKGVNWGVTVLTIAVLTPIATGDIGMKDLTAALRSPLAWVALASGILVAILGKGGVSLLAEEPHLTTALVVGTVVAIALFDGVAVGPIVAAGIAYAVMKLIEWFH
ncbi:DUF441 domain-containing protein [Bacillus thermotolerans]|uniref:DUF441 domain-containing protein n=1 Tax=Bacillus thermotolerans TaxID=1221996 RepID=UPI00057D9A99|nr:DUF441 domain-containing protein [Bacillus thermotolerans]KKB37609.1 putative membrane protein [Bacillus thermotolerans]KKB38186.1 putative membrane protein [Bacillus thermotolerans]